MKAGRVVIMMASTMTNEPRVRRQAAALASAGVEVVAIGAKADSGDLTREHLPGLNVVRTDTIDVRLVRRLKRLIAARSTDEIEREATGSEVPESVPTERRDWIGDIRTLVSWVTAAPVFFWHGWRAHGDLYHPHDIPPLLPALALGALTKRPVVYESHEYWWAKFPDRPMSRRVARWLERLALRSAADVIVVNDTIADKMAADYRTRRPSVVINVPRADPVEVLRPRQPGEPLEILYHGIVVDGRGVEHALEAIARATQPVVLTIRGSGDLLPELRRRAAQPDLAGRVRFEEPVPLDDLIASASTAHVGLLTFDRARGYEVALPNKLFEYMAAGLAVVATDLPELRRVVEQLHNGVLVDSPTPESIAAALDELASDPERVDAMRASSLAGARTAYHWSHHRQRFLDDYLPLLRRAPR